jgi:hypothetical protein
MVKGISKQVIVVQSPDPQLFEQAIFILKEGKHGVSDEALLAEAKRLINTPRMSKRMRFFLSGPTSACGGALLTSILWLMASLL